ncbi:MAG: phosphotransferase [Pseudoxanthomonas sp.]
MANPVVAVEADDLPLSFDSITDQWLSNVLCARHPGAAVTSHELDEPDVGTSNRQRIWISYNQIGREAGLPQSVFCKASHGLANRIALGLTSGATSEVYFYQHLRDKLNVEAPRCFHARIDKESCNSIVILEDLGAVVKEFCTHETKITRALAESLVRLLGRVHGQGYSVPEVKEGLKGMWTWPEIFEMTFEFGMKEGSNKGFLTAESVIPERLYRRYEEIWPATLKSVAFHEDVQHTLAHSDVHLRNWYIAGSGEMGLSDWQCAGRGHWGRDLAYALATSLDTQDRRLWEKDLVRIYLDELEASGGPRVGFEEAWRIYRQQMLGALAWWTFTLTPPPEAPDMQPPEAAQLFVGRIATAMDDIGSLDAFD